MKRLPPDVERVVRSVARRYEKEMAPLFRRLPRLMALAGVNKRDVCWMLERVLHPPKEPTQ